MANALVPDCIARHDYSIDHVFTQSHILNRGGWIIVYIEDYMLENKYYPLRKLTQETLKNLGAKEHPSFGLQIRLEHVKLDGLYVIRNKIYEVKLYNI